MTFEREIMRSEIDSLRTLYRYAFRAIEVAKDNPMRVAPHKQRELWLTAARRTDQWLAEIERILKQRIDRGVVAITGDEQPPRRKPREAA